MINQKQNEKHFPLAYTIALILSIGWLFLTLAGPIFYKLGESFRPFADFYYYLYHFTCHQMPDRCYWLFGYQLPVCVRCLGIYAGFVAGLLIYPFFKMVSSTEVPRKIWLIPCFLPIGIDGLAQMFHLYPSPHWLRLLTGLLCGGIAVIYLLPGLNELVSHIKKEIL